MSVWVGLITTSELRLILDEYRDEIVEATARRVLELLDTKAKTAPPYGLQSVDIGTRPKRYTDLEG